MVSLRQRRSQPSYTSLAGLENISDGEDNGTKPEGRGISGPTSGQDGGNDSDASMSSGGSSAFEPGAEDGGKTRKRPRGKGPRGLRRERSGSAFEVTEVDQDDGGDTDSMDIEPADTDLESIGEDPPVSKPKGKARVAARKQQRTAAPVLPAYGIIDTTASTGPSGDNTSLHPALKELIKQSAEVIAKGTKGTNTAATRDHEKYKTTGIAGFSTGPSTPFVTTLADDPIKNKVDIKVRWDAEDASDRKAMRVRENYGSYHANPLYSAWRIWQGEGWWPEMFTKEPKARSSNNQSKGKGKETSDGMLGSPNWRLREEVNIGLHHVGRLAVKDIVLLNEQRASSYMPDGGSVTCHMGPHDRQQAVSFDTLTSKPAGLQHHETFTQMFNVGGPIWGLDWCPTPSSASTLYLAVSPLRNLDDQPTVGTRRPHSDRASIQIWSLDGDRATAEMSNRMRCEMVLCVQGGPALALRWMPVGAYDEDDNGDQLPKLGILAALQLDGSISFYSIPQPHALRNALELPLGDPQPLFMECHDPLLRLEESEAVFTSFDWMSGSRVIAGLSNGHAAVYDVLDVLMGKRAAADLMPMAYAPVADGPVRAVAAARLPRSDSAGVPIRDSQPAYAVFTGYDASTSMMDVRDPEGIVQINKERKPSMDIAWSNQACGPVSPDANDTVQLYKTFGGGKNRTSGVTVHSGGIWSVTTSDYHTMVASASADGSLKVGSLLGGFYRKKLHPVVDHRRFEMDYDEHNGEYRMIEDFLPETIPYSQISDRFLARFQKLAPNDPRYLSTAAWSTHVAVHKVAWNNVSGLKHAGWLAAGLACGLCRIDWVEGK